MLLLLIPPVVKPCEPLLGAYSLARLARKQGIACELIDCSLEWVHHRIWGGTTGEASASPRTNRGTVGNVALSGSDTGAGLPSGDAAEYAADLAAGFQSARGSARSNPDPEAGGGLGWAAGRTGRRGAAAAVHLSGPAFRRASASGGRSDATRLRRARGRLEAGNPLTRPETFADPDRYRQALEHLQAVLTLGGGLGRDERPGLANFEARGLRPVDRGDLLAYASRDRTVFDDYLDKVLLPRIQALRPDTIGFSLTFLSQAFAAFRFAVRIRKRHPEVRLVLGGPMVACWRHADWGRPPLDLFDAVFSNIPPRPGKGPAGDLSPPRPYPGGAASGNRVFPLVQPAGEVFFPELQDLPPTPFFAPQAILPMAFGLGCSWGKCTFCPDRGRAGRGSGAAGDWPEAVEEWLSARGPLVLHLTDSCAEPATLDRLAATVRERQWPVRWYAFVRLAEALARPGRLESWARGGCGLLQFGLESASEELLRRMNKGISSRRASELLRQSAAAGIRNYVYLLFGFPGETAAQQQETLDFVLRHQGSIHYLNNAILNLPRDSPLARSPGAYGIEALRPFPGENEDLSLYTDFRDRGGAARQRARRFLKESFLAEAAVRLRVRNVPPVFTSNHAIFLEPRVR